MGAFSGRLKGKAIEFLGAFIRNIILAEIVVWAVGSDRNLTGLVAALGYSIGWTAVELICSRRDWQKEDRK